MKRILRCAAVLLALELIACLSYFVSVRAALTILVNPASGTVGTSVAVSGNASTHGETITVTFNDGTSTSTKSAVISDPTTGNWSASFAIPSCAAGPHTITASGTGSGTQSASFFVTPKISVNQTGGTAIIVSGNGFGSNENEAVTVDGISIASVSADTFGSWTGIISWLPAGSHTFGASGSSGNSASIGFNVISYAAITLGRTNGPVGTSVTINGTGFAPNETGIRVIFDGIQTGALINAGSAGNWTSSFSVPPAPGGTHYIGAYGSLTTASSVPTKSFSVTPTFTLNKSSGPPGTPVTATGSGFGASEDIITITYDGTPVGFQAAANSTGSWTNTFVIPQGAAGAHSVNAYGPSTPAAAVTTFSFMVSPGISINRNNGTAGTSVTVNGAGFVSGERGITITFDGDPVGPSVSASAIGSWTNNFTTLPSPAGTYVIGAYGSTTTAASVSGVTFTVTSSVILNITSGTVGTAITLSGTGFGSNETAIVVTYDGNQLGPSVSADSSGGWTNNFVIPSSAAGPHTISFKGPITSAVGTGTLTFTVVPSMYSDYSSGYVGSSVKISGSGFASKSVLHFTWDDRPINNTGAATSDVNGSFSQTITIPASQTGAHTIKVQDAQNNFSSSSFTIEVIIVPVPNPVSPEDGSKVGLTGDITPDFRWSPVSDPHGGITYSLQIDTQPDFKHPLLEKSGLTVTHYTLTRIESLPPGTYYWRVRAVDAASSQSAWSGPFELQSGVIPSSTLIILVVVVIAVLGTTFILIIRQRQIKGKMEAAAREAARAPAQIPEVMIYRLENREHLAIGPGDDDKQQQKALPWRLALPEAPQPVYGTKALPPADQARLKVIIDFAGSLPLIEPGNNTDWLIEMAETTSGEAASPDLYSKLLKSEIEVSYEPAWMRHPVFLDLQTILEGQSILQELNSFVETVNHSVSESVALLQDIHRDISAEITWDVIAKGGWGFVSGVYTDAISWTRGTYLREPSERDYSIKPAGQTEGGLETFDLYAESTTPFAGLLIHAPDEQEVLKLRTLHLKLRRTYRNNDRTLEIMADITLSEVQRIKLLEAFGRLNRLNP